MLPLRARSASLLAWALLSAACSSGSTPSDDSSAGADAATEPPPKPAPRFPVGTKLDAALSWDGYPAGSAEAGTIHLSDLADPDGSKGIRAIFVSEDQITCDACVEETQSLLAKAPAWTADGIAILQLVIFDANGQPASVADALAWRDHFQVGWSVGADPSFTFHEIGSNPLPVQLVVDPRTLTIVARFNGLADAAFSSAEQLAKKNSP